MRKRSFSCVLLPVWVGKSNKYNILREDFLMKKITTILAAAAAALMLVGCADLAGTGKATGTKSNKTINVDATSANTSKPLNELYRRYIKQLGSSEKVAGITTTITFSEADCILEGDDVIPVQGGGTKKGHAVIGFVFDLNKAWVGGQAATDTNDSHPRDFYVFGFDPLDKKVYIEKYANVNFKDELDTNDGTVGTPVETTVGNGAWYTLPSSEYAKYFEEKTVNGKKEYTVVVKVEPSNGQYNIYMGEKLLGTTTAEKHFKNNANQAIGGVAGYANCPKGTKLKVNYKTDTSTVIGTFYADEEE